MSNIYIQEPPALGKVLLTTSLGDIDIELWSKEAPKACRNFVQLCMEGYYNGTIFHRVVKDFIAQGGDPTGTGSGGESIYGEPFKDEFHQRLRFSRRGLVAMANSGPNDNGSQFFFTLNATPELDKKHTIFGKVTGNTIYNMARFADLDIDEDNRPYCPPKIIKTQILNDPFEDVVPRDIVHAHLKKDEEKKDDGKIKSKSKATKNYKLLSFGEEAEEDEEETITVSKDIQIKSSHDLLNDPKLSSEVAVEGEITVNKAAKESGDKEGDLKKRKKKTKERKETANSEDHMVGDDEEDEEEEKEKPKKMKREKDEDTEKETEVINKKKDKADNSTLMELAKERAEFSEKQKSNRMLKKGDGRQDETLALLASFQSKMSNMISQDDEDEEKDDSQEDGEIKDALSWASHKLKFDEHRDAKDANTKGDDWYDIYDPRNPVNKRRRNEGNDSKTKSKSKKP